MFAPSSFQQAIFDALQRPLAAFQPAAPFRKNLLIRAVAGSGKSTTIIQGMKLCAGTNIFLAFNKPIAEDLKAKGVKIVREPGPMKHGTGSNAIAFLEDPNGYKIELTTRTD